MYINIYQFNLFSVYVCSNYMLMRDAIKGVVLWESHRFGNVAFTEELKGIYKYICTFIFTHEYNGIF